MAKKTKQEEVVVKQKQTKATEKTATKKPTVTELKAKIQTLETEVAELKGYNYELQSMLGLRDITIERLNETLLSYESVASQNIKYVEPKQSNPWWKLW